MVELFLFSIAEVVLGRLGSATLHEIGLALGVKKELDKLKDILSTSKAVLLDAEEQQAKNRELRIWMERLKDVCYDADVVLDEFEIVALQRQLIHGSKLKKVGNFFSSSNSLVFRFRVGRKIKAIRERLDKIADDKAKFHLTEQNVDRSMVHGERETYSFLNTSDVIGRDQDKENIVDLLVGSDGHEGVHVVPIVGIGGLGKTTLAKMAYNDERVVKHFELKIWVCVSESFNVKKVIGDIIKSASGPNCKNFNVEQLQSCLREILKDRRFVLVLDDVWNEDPVKWAELRSLLIGGASGSKIIVTTRNQSVAEIVGTIPSYELKGLPEKDCLSLFVRWAFKEGQEVQHANLMIIGEEIVKKCKGVPLAIRTLGSLLYMKTNESDWFFVRENEIWKLEQEEGGILPALRLSYEQLPSYLKQCFAYCSILAKDYQIDSADLIRQWMAQGFIQPSNQNQELEDIGKKYIHELCSKSFFQDVDDCGYFITFKIHDLVHDLALSVAQTEYSIINIHSQNVSRKVQHVSFCESDPDLSLDELPSSLFEVKNLRTINFQFEGVGATSKSFVETCTSRFKCLRVLDLSESRFEALPSSIGRLKHLRYLALNNNRSIRSLPNSVCQLLCLQTLYLKGCEKFEKLPRDFGNLISLRYLSLTTRERCLSEKAIGSLTSLRTLWIGECGNLEFLFDGGMQHLAALRTLTICSCERLVSLPHKRGLRYLTALENLVIVDCENLDLTKMENQLEKEDGSLRSLRFFGISEVPKLVALPQWLQGASNTLKHIVIGDCPNFTTLPGWMENLKSLQKLRIEECPQLTSLPEGMHRLTTLREIRMGGDCPELIRRCQRETGEDWHKIAHVPNIYVNDIKI